MVPTPLVQWHATHPPVFALASSSASLSLILTLFRRSETGTAGILAVGSRGEGLRRRGLGGNGPGDGPLRRLQADNGTPT